MSEYDVLGRLVSLLDVIAAESLKGRGGALRRYEERRDALLADLGLHDEPTDDEIEEDEQRAAEAGVEAELAADDEAQVPEPPTHSPEDHEDEPRQATQPE